MFSGSPRRRDNAKVIRLGAVSNITLAGDDPDFIVLEVFNAAFSTSKINLPNTAPIGKVFKFALVTDPSKDPMITTQYIDIIIPLPKGVGPNNTWPLYSGARPIFTYGPNGWVADTGSTLPLTGSNNAGDKIGRASCRERV